MENGCEVSAWCLCHFPPPGPTSTGSTRKAGRAAAAAAGREPRVPLRPGDVTTRPGSHVFVRFVLIRPCCVRRTYNSWYRYLDANDVT